jgi:hypothetical protein
VVFFSGGKKSVAAFSHAAKEAAAAGLPPPILLTTFNARTRRLDSVRFEQQPVGIDAVIEKARVLGAHLVGVPLHGGGDAGYIATVGETLRWVDAEIRSGSSDGRRLNGGVGALVFGDTGLVAVPVRKWREQHFQTLLLKPSLKLAFPLWEGP